MAGGKRRDEERGQGHLGVWDPTGGEPRDGSGLPVEKGSEEIRILARDANGGVRGIRREELGSVLKDPGSLVWIDLLCPREKAKELLRDQLCLSPLTVEDCLSPLRMPKIDVFPGEAGGAFVAAFAARLGMEGRARLRAVEVDLVVGRNYLVTVRDGVLSEIFERLERRLRSAPPGSPGSGDTLAYEAMDALIDRHLPALVDAATAAEELEESLDPRNEQASTERLENLISLRRDLQAFRRLALAQHESLRRLARVSPGMRDHLSDAADNQREVVDMADATRDYVEGAIEAYRMSRDERTETGIRRLTVLAALLGPLTVLAGWYGMNFAYLPGAGKAWAFWVFVGAQLAFVVVAVWFLRRRGLF